MEHISEEANTSEMRPEQILDGIAFVVTNDADDTNPFSVFIENDNKNKENDDDLSFFGVGGPA